MYVCIQFMSVNSFMYMSRHTRVSCRCVYVCMHTHLFVRHTVSVLVLCLCMLCERV